MAKENIKYHQAHSDKPMSGTKSPSCDQYNNNLKKIIKWQTDPYNYGKAMKK